MTQPCSLHGKKFKELKNNKKSHTKKWRQWEAWLEWRIPVTWKPEVWRVHRRHMETSRAVQKRPRRQEKHRFCTEGISGSGPHRWGIYHLLNFSIYIYTSETQLTPAPNFVSRNLLLAFAKFEWRKNIYCNNRPIFCQMA